MTNITVRQMSEFDRRTSVGSESIEIEMTDGVMPGSLYLSEAEAITLRDGLNGALSALELDRVFAEKPRGAP